MTSRSLVLFTDFYELTMAQAYLEEGMTDDAVFSLFVRSLPPQRNYLLACGLGTALDYLENLRFEEEDLTYLSSLKKFSDRFLDWLRNFRFTGTVYAVPEGTPIFGNEPILEVVAPLPEAQLVETFVMNQIHLQTVLCSKAHRVVMAASGRTVIDFGSRRIHGIDAALKAARAFYIGGVAATSNVLAAKIYGIPVTGTMAHSYIQAHSDEMEAFQAFARIYPDTILLVDTYDPIEGVRKVIELAKLLGEAFKVKGIRLDSGDLLDLSRRARGLLDHAGLEKVQIFASGGLDEDSIRYLVSSKAPIDGFGVGTNMAVSQDAPVLDIAYKLCQYAGGGRLKLSPGKVTLPGRKQIFRMSSGEHYERDVVARADEHFPGDPLLSVVMRGGERVGAGTADLESAREHARRETARLPAHLLDIKPAMPPYPVGISPGLSQYQRELEKQLRGL